LSTSPYNVASVDVSLEKFKFKKSFGAIRHEHSQLQRGKFLEHEITFISFTGEEIVYCGSPKNS